MPRDEYALPPAIDVEYVGNCSARPDKDKFLKELDDYVDAVTTHYDVQPILYITKEFYDDYLADTKYMTFPLWVRDVWLRPDIKGYPTMVYLKYADNGRLTGINGPVDWNVQIKQQK